jgi:ribonuclease E
VKEERGNKGAALTTYLSLAGRYSVLMPNTARGGGISRKITSADDRKRLKTIAQDLEVPEGMGVILRTAGASRTRPEIKRDFEYLMRMWESVRELTLKSSAPALVYEEGSLIKRAIRDLYNKDIDEVLVSGEDGYREAKDFMRMLMPSHAKVVKPYREPNPLFARFGVEQQLDAMFSNNVSLKSGGYLVINPTEALVSIDVNSGRSTREHNIEDTALKTNLEAADEVARQLRLRDLAGLIVIDFIDMDEKRNNRAVEKRLKDALKTDRARIQVGRISAFGLMEMSRQRIRTGVLESSSVPCPVCAGIGSVRATPSVALHVLRSIEEQLIKSASHNLNVRTHMAVAFYILNQKRLHLRELEERFGVEVMISVDETLPAGTSYAVDRTEPALRVESRAPATGIKIDTIAPVEIEDDPDPEVEEDETEETEAEAEAPARAQAKVARSENGDGEGEGEGGRRRRRRRRRRGRGNGEMRDGASSGNGDTDDEGEEPAGDAIAAQAPPRAAEESSDGRRRRNRRGGRGGRGIAAETADEAAGTDLADVPLTVTEPVVVEPAAADAAPEPETAEAIAPEAAPAAKPRARRRRRVEIATEEAPVAPEPVAEPVAEASEPPAAPAPEPEPIETPVPAIAAAEPERTVSSVPQQALVEPEVVVLTPPDPNRPKRAGWWSKAKAALTGE